MGKIGALISRNQRHTFRCDAKAIVRRDRDKALREARHLKNRDLARERKYRDADLVEAFHIREESKYTRSIQALEDAKMKEDSARKAYSESAGLIWLAYFKAEARAKRAYNKAIKDIEATAF